MITSTFVHTLLTPLFHDRSKAAIALPARLADERADEIAIIAHELRNSLSVVRNAARLLRLPADVSGVEGARILIERHVGQMSQHIQDLLDLPRGQGRHKALRRSHVDLRSVIEFSVSAITSDLVRRGHRLELHLPAEGLFVHADVTRLEQVFSNLLINAAKYTPDGGVITIAMTRQGAQACISIRDSGIGIEPAVLLRVFDLFAQADALAPCAEGGSGIGLAVVRDLVEMHGGSVRAAERRSRAGQRIHGIASFAVDGSPLKLSSLLLALLVLGTSTMALGAPAGAAPANSTPTPYGSGWDCVRGFRRTGEACVKLQLPDHAYLSTSGHDWDCDRGHLKRGDACLAVKLPANSHADDGEYGTGWRCDRGFRLSEGSCRRLAVPEHAFLVNSSFGRGWECERGYRADGARCQRVQVPAHGFLRESGDEWECERGYVRSADVCAVVPVPANAYLDKHGNDWKCERGFGRVGQTCAKLAPPANAFLDYSGNDWQCADGFVRQTGACVARN